RRWPVDPLWEEIRAVRIAPTVTGVVRKRLLQGSELRLLPGLPGYATSLAALRDRRGRDDALDRLGRPVAGYLAPKGRRFEGEVKRKQDRQMTVTAILDADRCTRMKLGTPNKQGTGVQGGLDQESRGRLHNRLVRNVTRP